MFVNEEFNNSKSNFSNTNVALYFSPYIHKKKSIGNLYTEPRKIPIEKDSNSRNKIKQKVNYSIKLSNSNIKIQQDGTKSLKITSDKNKKGRNMHQSYIKLNTKLYLKKNAIPNLASFNDFNSQYPPTPLMKNSTTNIIMTNSIKSVEKNNFSVGKNKNKNGNKNIKLIFEKNSSNSLNLNTNSKNYNTNSNSNLLKKTAGSSNELFRNNFIKKSKTNNISNQIGYILTTTGNSNSQSKTPFLSPQNMPGQKIIFLRNDKNKIKEAKEKSRKSSTSTTNKDQKKLNSNKKMESKLNSRDINLNLDERNKSVQYLLRNTYNNVKIYPTTVLNNKIIFQDNKKKEKLSHSVTNSENSSMHNSSSKKKNDSVKNKLNINLINYKKNRELRNKENNECESVEEVHFLLIKTIHNGRKMIINMDRKNK
jgi:hypothetical protein